MSFLAWLALGWLAAAVVFYVLACRNAPRYVVDWSDAERAE